jgi:hypothetical protein
MQCSDYVEFELTNVVFRTRHRKNGPIIFQIFYNRQKNYFDNGIFSHCHDNLRNVM